MMQMRIKDLLEPLRRRAAHEAAESDNNWVEEFDRTVSNLLGCSVQELGELGTHPGRGRGLQLDVDAAQWIVDPRTTVSIRLPLGCLGPGRNREWLRITQYRQPRTVAHTWRLQREAEYNDDHWYTAIWGWYWPKLTTQELATATHLYMTSAHYKYEYDQIVWRPAGVAAGVAPLGHDLVGRLDVLTQMLAATRPSHRLQVRRESNVQKRAEDIPLERWGYRVLDAREQVVSASSERYPNMGDRYWETPGSRAGAVQAGAARVRSERSREGEWEDV